jgi:hypothetical protein
MYVFFFLYLLLTFVSVGKRRDRGTHQSGGEGVVNACLCVSVCMLLLECMRQCVYPVRVEPF